MENKNIIIILVAIIVILAAAIGFALFNPLVAKEPCKVLITSDKEQYEGGELSIILADLNKTPISKEIVNVTITNSKGKVVVDDVVKTNAKGKAKLDLNLKKGVYKVVVAFGGNENYTGTNRTQKLTIKEEVVEAQPTSSYADTSYGDSNYYNGYSRSEFSEGEQAAIDEARANGYASPADYYQATGKTAGQWYLDAHPEYASMK